MPDTQQLSKSDLRSAWKRAVSRLEAMSDKKRAETLVDAGIITAGGKPRKPYKHLFVSHSTKDTKAGVWNSKEK
ncbi:hypothetical protein [Prosthecobacter sp.]|uniref:hypothetical protein n=1 Tax=Prosthecobacter sp. TaxID=1965333 RepID=UPI002486E32F|nr:hypothetical protein [Prosthecobacter sp.]MDI1310935.1 hypothetical protein [Prosthecobacter sp.]